MSDITDRPRNFYVTMEMPDDRYRRDTSNRGRWQTSFRRLSTTRPGALKQKRAIRTSVAISIAAESK